ncbi:MAG TPA: hypothetical protein VMM55_11780, partial [Thermohalobaculum sp.]|nr:hypothetical protein [Thermohalobaculum sp.]
AGRGAVTTVAVSAPCQAGTAAVLDYGGLSLAVPLDAGGKGAIDVPGFKSRMDATLTFEDGETMPMTLPFEEIQRVERVALVWDMPVGLELHALEFGADRDSDAHVGPEDERSFNDVRRSGGGFLQAFAPADGAGQHARVYTYYLRAGGPSGVVRMMVDFASRRAGADGTCGDGPLASPGFTVLRTSRGMEERPIRSRLAAAGCGGDAEAAGEMIGNAVGNLVIAD